jgi:hypothetical protein
MSASTACVFLLPPLSLSIGFLLDPGPSARPHRCAHSPQPTFSTKLIVCGRGAKTAPHYLLHTTALPRHSLALRVVCRFGTVETVRLDRDDTNREQIVVRCVLVFSADTL